MRVKPFDVGVESIARWQVSDEVHLPASGPRAPAYLPQPRALDAILRRPSLDERLPHQLLPDRIDPSLLEPAMLTQTRLAAQHAFQAAAHRMTGRRRALLEMAAGVLAEDAALDAEIRLALGALLRG